jgi:Flp pilus assembly pilin Flp
MIAHSCPFRGRRSNPLGIMDREGNEHWRRPMLTRFLQDEHGQDLIEYTLLVAFVCLATAALFVNSGGSLSGIWISANSRLGAANTSAS